ncbi:MAG: hypothetical protein JWN71_3102 [Xanthobacteraceae bacterium]|nr:hypothetical protein [Xanthobacteraceae bacterium]
MRGWSPFDVLRRIALYVVPGFALAGLLAIIVSKVIFRAPEYDEAEVLHASWLIANVGRIWVDVFEHHSPLFNTINARIFDTNAPFFALYAKLTALFSYLLGSFLFALASYLWLNVARRWRLSFLLYAQAAYLFLTWPVDLGVVRPENYSMLALMVGSLFGYGIVNSRSFRFYAYCFFCAFFLAVAVSFSPRTIFLSAAVGLLVIWTRRDRGSWIAFAVMIGLGGGAAIALNLTIAPLSGFLLWMVQFNSKLLPYTRALWQASYGSIAVGLVSVAATCVGLAAFMIGGAARQNNGPGRATPATILALLAGRRLLGAQAVMLVCWAFLFVDHHWGRQSFGAIAVATSAYTAVFLAILFKTFDLISIASRMQGFALPRLLPAALVAALLIVGLPLAYWSAGKIGGMVARLQPAGMLTDLAITSNEQSYRLQNPNDLPPLSEAGNLGERLLWSRRYCELFRNERILAIPTRHPVCARDATYYWYGGIHFRAMARERVAFTPDPPYNVAEDVLKTKPAFIDVGFLDESVLPDPRVEAMLKDAYVPIHSNLIGNWAWLRKDFLERQR